MKCRNCGSESISDNICNSCGTEQNFVFNNNNLNSSVFNIFKIMFVMIFIFIFFTMFAVIGGISSTVNLVNENMNEFIPDQEITNDDWMNEFHKDEYHALLRKYNNIQVDWKNVIYSMSNYNFEVSPDEFENIILSNIINQDDNENVTESVN